MRYSPPTIIDKINERIPRKARIAVDLLLAAALLIGIYAAAGSPAFGEEARFRRAEKVGLVGPSVQLDRIFLRSDWPYTAYNLLYIGDDGDQILFYAMRTGIGVSSESDRLSRREKTDGVLLTPLPTLLRRSYGEGADAFFAVAARELHRADLPRAWRAAAAELPLPPEEREIVAQLGARLTGDEAAVCGALTLGASQLRRAADAIEGQRTQKERLTSTLCLGAGALLALMLL